MTIEYYLKNKLFFKRSFVTDRIDRNLKILIKQKDKYKAAKIIEKIRVLLEYLEKKLKKENGIHSNGDK